MGTIEQTQKRLQEGEAQFRDLVESLPDYIVVYGQNREIVYINPAAEGTIGYDADTIIGMPVLAFVAEEFRENAVALIDECEEYGRIPVSEVEVVTKEGLKRSVIVKGTKVQFNNNPATFLLLVDITQRKELERVREEHTRELERYSSSLHQAGRQLSLLTSITRHDILNKISIIYLYLGLAELQYPEPGLSEYLTIMKQVTNDIQSQIEFTRVYEGLGVQEPQWQELDAIMPRSSIPETHHHEDGVTGYLHICRPDAGSKVFFNLLDNSVRHGQRVTEIRVSAYQSASDLVVVWGG